MRFLVLLAGATLLGASRLHAVPAFARQTGFACSQCHYQHFPTLNEFGRRFKLEGFSLINTAKVEGSRLSLPAGLNASLYLKLRMQKTNGTDAAGVRTTNSGEIQFPDEFALLLAGRISKNIGFILEGQLPSGGDAMMASFKIPFSYDVGKLRASAIPFTTDALGASYGFELLNTGAVANIRPIEHGEDFSAQQYIGTGTAASGAAFVLGNSRFFFNYSRWSPVHLAAAQGLASPLPHANYARLAFLPKVGDWDVGVGGQAWFGTARLDDGSGTTTVTNVGTKAWSLDAQAQGAVGSLPLGVFASYASAKASSPGGDPNFFNAGPRARKAFAIMGELGVLPARGTLMLAYRHGDNGAATNHQDRSVTVGGIYQLHQNVRFELNYSFRSGDAYSPKPGDGDQLLSALLAAAF